MSLRFKVLHSLQDVNAEQPGPGDDAALACLVSSQDKICRSQHLGLSQERFGFLVAAEGMQTDLLLGTELVRLWSAFNLLLI